MLGARLPCPYEAKLGFVTMHPWFPFALMSQSVELMSVLDCTALDKCVHPYNPNRRQRPCMLIILPLRRPRGTCAFGDRLECG